jgi:hypothetical protein
MDKINSKRISEYVQNLPETLKELIFDTIWLDKTNEIAKKYNLNPEQTETLLDTTLLTLIGLEKPENFLETIIIDLKISRLLGEQIKQDIGSRVFDYSIKFIEGKAKKIEPIVNSKIPEIRPANLPIVEKTANSTPMFKNISVPPQNIPKKVEPAVQAAPKVEKAPEAVSKVVYKPIEEVKTEQKKPEPVQRPVAVHRFVGLSMDENGNMLKPDQKPEIKAEVKPETKIEPKIEMKVEQKTENMPKPEPTPAIVSAVKPLEPTKPQAPAQSVASKYQVDPYREAIE